MFLLYGGFLVCFFGEGRLLSVGEYFKCVILTEVKYSFPPPAWLTLNIQTTLRLLVLL